MSNRYQQICILALLSLYGILFYFIFKNYQRLDFSIFYSSFHALLQGENPYRNLFTTYFPTVKILPVNLNPPFALWSFSFLAQFSYYNALLVWSIFSFILGIMSAIIIFHYAFSVRFFNKNHLSLYLLYFAFFPSLTNVSTQQFGYILLFLIMLGYYFYLNHRDYLAGMLWGIIISIKLFPALLFLYVLKQGRLKVFGSMLITVVIALILPILVYGTIIYKQYFKMLTAVGWYGDGWNASIYGFMFRLFFGDDIHPGMTNLIPIEMIYGVLFFILILWYWKKLGSNDTQQINHQPFCLTLAMMLFVSPFGWVYYFPLLIFPLILTWFVALDEKHTSVKTMLIWFLCLFLVNFPIDYVKTQNMPNLLGRISFFSSFFYGLLCLIYLLGKRKEIYGNNELKLDEAKNFMPAIIIILAFGLAVPIVRRIFQLNLHFL